MSKIIHAVDILDDAKSCVECIFMAAHDLDDATDPIQTVANIASWKINEAIALLDEYRTEMRLVATEAPDASPISDSPSVKPASRPTRTKRKGKGNDNRRKVPRNGDHRDRSGFKSGVSGILGEQNYRL